MPHPAIVASAGRGRSDSLPTLLGSSPVHVYVDDKELSDKPDSDCELPEMQWVTEQASEVKRSIQLVAPRPSGSSHLSGSPVDNVITGGISMTSGNRWDIFLSHLQRNAQDAIISMLQFLKSAQPGLKCFIDLEVNMAGAHLGRTLHNGVANSKSFLFFITHGVLNSPWCLQEIRWAVELEKNIILVRETDERHGGLSMTEFLKQVPADLQETFRNIIAIPWYREPQYRDVSVKSILQAAGLKDTFGADMMELSQAKSDLESVFVHDPATLTAIDVISEHSPVMRIVFFLGGFWQFRNKRLNFIYCFIFAFSFWFCGLLCGINLVYQGLPYHVITTDALTAYVHLPAWQSWRCWRRFVNGTGLEELLTAVKAHPSNARKLKMACRIGGVVVILMQLTMASVVLIGFSLPYEVLHNHAEKMEDHTGSLYVLHNLFMKYHARAMWFVIPPVIAALFCSYSLFAFVAFLHLLDIDGLKVTIESCAIIVLRFQLKHNPKVIKKLMRTLSLNATNSDGEEEVSLPSPAGSGATFQTEETLTANIADLQTVLARQGMESQLFTTIARLFDLAVSSTQKYCDYTCNELGWLWLHLVFFSMCQVFVILSAIRSHVWGALSDTDYEWWWGFQDFFHLFGGIVLLIAALGIFCTVTTVLRGVPSFALEKLRAAGCPPERLGSLWGLLAAQPLGMHVFYGSLHIDVSKAVGLFVVLLAATLQTMAMTIETIDIDY